MRAFTISALVLALGASGVAANDFTVELTALAEGQITEISSSDEVVSAIKAQNSLTAGYDQAKIDELDETWQTEADSIEQPMIDEVLDRAVSTYLADLQEASGGLFTEIFVMDAKGLNVGQSDVTSDYWQGDEDKFLQTFPVGAGAVHISGLEQDDSTQILQSQVSVSITDPATGDVIGAATFGVNVNNL